MLQSSEPVFSDSYDDEDATTEHEPSDVENAPLATAKKGATETQEELHHEIHVSKKSEEADSNYDSEASTHSHKSCHSTGRSSPEDQYKLLLAAHLPDKKVKPLSPKKHVEHVEEVPHIEVSGEKHEDASVTELSDSALDDEESHTEDEETLEPGQCFKVLHEHHDKVSPLKNKKKSSTSSSSKRKVFQVLDEDENHHGSHNHQEIVKPTTPSAQGCKHEMLQELLKEIFLNDDCPVSFFFFCIHP